jgi:HEAT repeat protein
MAHHPPAQPGRSPRASTPARHAAEWFRQLEDFAHSARALGAGSPQLAQRVERLVEDFAGLADAHAPLAFRISPQEIWLRDELVVRSSEGPGQGGPFEQPLSHLFHRDGITGISIDAGSSRNDARTLAGALARVVGAPSADEDLVTLLWAADLDGLRLEVEPLDTNPFAQAALEPFHGAAQAALAPSAAGEEPAADRVPADPVAAWHALQPDAPAALAAFGQAWAEERAQPWGERVERLVGDLLALGDGPEVAEALTRALAGWLAAATQVGDWDGAAWAWNSMRRVDPQRQWSDARIAEALGALDAPTVSERLDEGESEAAARFFALTVHVGRPALDFVARVLSRSSRQRVRAAATTALAYLCAEDPRPLAPYLRDSRWFVARNVVFVLGQVGGEAAGAMLTSALGHSDARVRRAAVTALGQVPLQRRTALLTQHLDGQDPVTLEHVLAMLTREPEPGALAAVLERVLAPDFETRPEEERVALIAALGEMGGEAVLPELERILHAGGWFARRSPERTAVAMAIAHIDTPPALRLLHEGQRARAEAVRSACLEALGGRERTA